MTKLYKTYRNACRIGSADAVTLDGVDGFMPNACLIVVDVIAEGAASASPVQTRTFRVVKTASGLFGTTWHDREQPTKAQTLFSTKEGALAAHDGTLARYAADARWQYGR